MKSDSLLLYAVTDSRLLCAGETLEQKVLQAIDGGITFLQLREKNADCRGLLRTATALKKLCAARGIPFVINDYVETAAACKADGVHVGQSDVSVGRAREILGNSAIVGASVQTVGQALAAERAGASYLGVGAVFHTDSKADAADVPFKTLREICAAVKIPVVAIGGITAENIGQLAGSGIAGVAAISAVFAQPDISGAARMLRARAEKLFARRGTRTLTSRETRS